MNSQRKEIISYFKQMDRSFFMDTNKDLASFDQALPIGFEQTISQPSLVLEMTLALDLQPKQKVLELGTGSGFQTALLAAFSGTVYTIERIEELQKRAKERSLRLTKSSTISKSSKKHYGCSATVSDFGWSLPHSSSLGSVVIPETAMVRGNLS